MSYKKTGDCAVCMTLGQNLRPILDITMFDVLGIHTILAIYSRRPSATAFTPATQKLPCALKETSLTCI